MSCLLSSVFCLLCSPIEVGAAVSAYQLGHDASRAAVTAEPSGRSSREVFVLSTVKGFAGHSEAGAGAVAVLEAAALMQQRAIAPILHLRALNPYIAGQISSTRIAINRSTGLMPMPLWQQASASGVLAMGISSFGAQGQYSFQLCMSVTSCCCC